MHSTASIRDLRNHFPRIRRILDTEGEVLLTESGKTKYRLTPYAEPATKASAPVDFFARLISYQPDAISAQEAQSLHDENRGDR
jgi:antitoxin (DNA-binding transcriptional repressor) of toxin-antitoxin stability system